MLTAVASDDGDRAPRLVSGRLSGRYHGRSFAAWQAMYDALADGEWHPQRDLIRAAQMEIAGLSTRGGHTILSYATTDGHVEREYRAPTMGFDLKPEPWYRRNREETPDA